MNVHLNGAFAFNEKTKYSNSNSNLFRTLYCLEKKKTYDEKKKRENSNGSVPKRPEER